MALGHTTRPPTAPPTAHLGNVIVVKHLSLALDIIEIYVRDYPLAPARECTISY